MILEKVLIPIVLSIAAILALRRILSRLEAKARFVMLGSIAISLLGVFLALQTRVTPKPLSRDPEGYENLVHLLELKHQSDSTGRGHLMVRSAGDDEIGRQMAKLNIDCVLYVHERWGGYYQKGIVATTYPIDISLFIYYRTRAYKVVDGELKEWTESERSRGPGIYYDINNYIFNRMEPYCADAG